jgi:hypothetical protein
MEGASWWNQAFESAGFINAFRSKFYLKMQINGSSFQYDKLGAPRNERLEFWLCR